MTSTLLTRTDFESIGQACLSAATADDVVVAVSDRAGGTTRFANNQTTQNVSSRRRQCTVTVAFGKRRGSASTTDLAPESLRQVVSRAEQIARLAPEDREYLSPLPAQQYPDLPTHRPETAATTPADRADAVKQATDLCAAADMQGAGIISTYASVDGLAASSGLRMFEPRTRAEFSLTATAGDSSGWVKNAVRGVGDLDVDAMTRRAIDKARRSANPREVPAGRYTVILEPPAVQGLVGPLTWNLGARAYHRGTTALAGKLDQQIIDPRLTLANRPEHRGLFGERCNGSGVPNASADWIERGVLRRLNYDRWTAQEHGVAPTAGVDAVHLSGPADQQQSLADLVAGTERGILVTHFWYIRYVNQTDMTLTGMTRDGTFLIEDGQIADGLVNFRFHDSPLRALNAVLGFSAPDHAIATAGAKMMLPALKIGDFHFSSVTRF